jgi:lysophospholipase L1-like esterase
MIIGGDASPQASVEWDGAALARRKPGTFSASLRLPSRPNIQLAYYLTKRYRAGFGGAPPPDPPGISLPSFERIDEVRLEPIRGRLRKLAQTENLQTIDLPAAFKGHESTLEMDGVHPDVEGMKLIAEAVRKTILNE